MLPGFESQSRRRAHSAGALDSLRLKNSRSGCLPRVTALYRAIRVLQEDAKNVREVSEKLLEINEVFSRFEKAHYGYIATLTDNLEELEKESLYFKEHCKKEWNLS